jgi:hypothetical protein
MRLKRWSPRRELSEREEMVMKRLVKTRKLFAFLRTHRHDLFEEAFQAELEAMYRQSGAGKPAIPPAVLAMVVLLQAYVQASDAEAVELTVVDSRWQLVLDCVGSQRALFAQSTLVEFRSRLIRTGMDRRLLERTVALAKTTGAFDAKKLPKTLRLAVDSSPLEGAGRVEDTINLLAHAARKLVTAAAALVSRSVEDVAREAGIPVLVASSPKRALDLDWSDAQQRAGAVGEVVRQIDCLERWVRRTITAEQCAVPPLSEALATLDQIRSQDLEPDPGGTGGTRIRKGVAVDRRVSIEDAEMRHGRKSKSKRFNGYKRHVATELETKLVLACAITPANAPEADAAPALLEDLERDGRPIAELFIDRGYICSALVRDVQAGGGEVLCKPWIARNAPGLFTKADFKIDMRALTITCPAGQVEQIETGTVVEFDPDICGGCALRQGCTMAGPEHGRTISIGEDERLQHRLRKLFATRSGRERLRQRTGVEHRLAHVSQRQGHRARYLGARKNLFDLRRTAAIQNLETIHRNLNSLALAMAA